MNIPCCNKPSLCSDAPVSNYSSEEVDVDVTYCAYYGQGLFPPLGNNWRSDGCVVFGVEPTLTSDGCGTVSASFQESQREAIECRRDDWDPPPGDGGPSGRPLATFVNEEQSCDFTCPDGNVFTYTVPAGAFSAFSQAGANAIAFSVACNKSIDLRICIGELTPSSCCIGSTYSGTVSFDGPTQDYTATIISGSLPPGIGFAQDEQTGVFSGTPTASGTFSVLLNVEDPSGNFMQKTIAINVVEILPSSLPDGSVGSAYSEALSTNPGTLASQTWSIVAGALPTGLTLGPFPASAILGVPTVVGTFTFTVRVVDTSL